MDIEEINLLKKFNPGDEYTERIKSAIEHLLAEREEDKKRIKELEEENKKNIERYEERDNEVWERVKQCKNMQTEIDRLYAESGELQQACLHEKLAKEEVEELLENSIPVQKVKDKIEKHKFAKNTLKKEYDNKHYEDDGIRARDFYGIVTQDRIIQVLEEFLEDK